MTMANTMLFRITVFLLMNVALTGMCQQTMFSLLKADKPEADAYFRKGNYAVALDLYLAVARRSGEEGEIQSKIARCHFELKAYEKAVNAWEKAGDNLELTPVDQYLFAEALSMLGSYDRAISVYEDYLVRKPDDQLVTRKLWRLKNIQFLYEDSLHYALRPVPLNSGYGDMCAVPYEHGFAFISNRAGVRVIHKTDGSINAPFYRIFHTTTYADTLENIGTIKFGEPAALQTDFDSRFHMGPFALYAGGKKMVFAATSDRKNHDGSRTLQLHFAELKDGVWRETYSFPFNSHAFSITDPAIDEEGNLLYFSSDMKGGFGGRDLYRSELKGGAWTTPVNLGEAINTERDEVFPFIYRMQALYFASDGHAGLGGLDVFRSEIDKSGFGEVQNLGYPINSNLDDFSISMDASGSHGYITSNRKNGGFDDDIYEFDVDLQTYPLTIHGLVKYREHAWSDSSELNLLPNVEITLVDHIRNVDVFQSRSDEDGNFSLVIPYFSKYIIRVTSEEAGDNIVSLEIPKHKREDARHEIVIVKDAFRSHENAIVR